ncbi:hypothetical protein R3P38DRAFT_2582166 [Favolaschia claudopus]|uniref:Uncharacterized protein n=1 Tax=Favolaschia claudopus TaxID=2862362 RepID=A0AAV9ZAN2_9AGAR
MPESQVLRAFLHRIRQICNKAYLKGYLGEGGLPSHIPRAWAEGTATKAHETFSVDIGDYSESLEPTQVPVDQHDDKKFAKKAPGRYLLTQQLKDGPVHAAVRGKSLAISAGYHAIVVHFALEGNLIPMSRAKFEEIVADYVPGNNKNKGKANRLRSFSLPSYFLDPGARVRKDDFKINILAAIVMEEDVLVITDFSRMSQIHVVSSGRMLNREDMRPGSELWTSRLWTRFRSAPEWIVETVTDLALAGLDEWRQRIIEDHDVTPILDVLLQVNGPGAGIGQHLANDLLFEMALHPDTPSFSVCSDDSLYAELRAHIPRFMETWKSEMYLERCASTPNTNNPLSFNTGANDHFLATYVRVYRKTRVRVPATLYDLYQSRGLLDPDHIIGTPYRKPWTSTDRQYKFLPVRLFKDSQKNNRYHVILAKPPPTWVKIHTEATLFTDVANTGFATTLGPASFFEPMQNKADPNQLTLLRAGKRGRPPKASLISSRPVSQHSHTFQEESTGKAGRPCKPLTKKAIKRIMAVPRSLPRSSTGDDKENVSERV